MSAASPRKRAEVTLHKKQDVLLVGLLWSQISYEELDEMRRCVQVPGNAPERNRASSMEICANEFQRSHRKHSISGIFFPVERKEEKSTREEASAHGG
jgi:hypothetical protein